MASGTTRTVMSQKVIEGASEESILDAITNSNEEAIKKEKKGKQAK